MNHPKESDILEEMAGFDLDKKKWPSGPP
ncbi:hypothetical protein CARN8_1350006 [mine drainage metagenome]|uniref:Uncharacterized protein n=1 Tax=mine drainage metagenome TaxID=410659 RepID=A0A3P3ZLK1_9ZZZZ